jgi:deazaflavin-dependent oxidoreductase (nitroreductase family)
MPVKIKDVKPPSGFNRLLWRAPIWLYRWNLGWMMGGRFLLLNHVGRKSGLPRQAVVEIVAHDPESGQYSIASGFGAKSDWYQNLRATPEITIKVGSKDISVTAVPLSPDESGAAMVDYAQRNPTAAKGLMRVCGYQVDGTNEDYYTMGYEHIPFIKLIPREDQG